MPEDFGAGEDDDQLDEVLAAIAAMGGSNGEVRERTTWRGVRWHREVRGVAVAVFCCSCWLVIFWASGHSCYQGPSFDGDDEDGEDDMPPEIYEELRQLRELSADGPASYLSPQSYLHIRFNLPSLWATYSQTCLHSHLHHQR